MNANKKELLNQTYAVLYNWKSILFYIIVGVTYYASMLSYALSHAPPDNSNLELLPPIEGIFKYEWQGNCSGCGISTLDGEKISCGGYGFFSGRVPCEIGGNFDGKRVRIYQILVPSNTGKVSQVLKIESLSDSAKYGINNFITKKQWLRSTESFVLYSSFSILLYIILLYGIIVYLYNSNNLNRQ
jgi:hypothetical protein